MVAQLGVTPGRVEVERFDRRDLRCAEGGREIALHRQRPRSRTARTARERIALDRGPPAPPARIKLVKTSGSLITLTLSRHGSAGQKCSGKLKLTAVEHLTGHTITAITASKPRRRPRPSHSPAPPTDSPARAKRSRSRSTRPANTSSPNSTSSPPSSPSHPPARGPRPRPRQSRSKPNKPAGHGGEAIRCQRTITAPPRGRLRDREGRRPPRVDWTVRRRRPSSASKPAVRINRSTSPAGTLVVRDVKENGRLR